MEVCDIFCSAIKKNRKILFLTLVGIVLITFGITVFFISLRILIESVLDFISYSKKKTNLYRSSYGYCCCCEDINLLNSQLQLVEVYSDKHYFILSTDDQNISIYDIKTKSFGAFLDRRNSEDLTKFLDGYLDAQKPSNIRTSKDLVYEEPRSVVCRYNINVKDVPITLCFTDDEFLSGGFMNSVILSRCDIIKLYHVIKVWMMGDS